MSERQFSCHTASEKGCGKEEPTNGNWIFQPLWEKRAILPFALDRLCLGCKCRLHNTNTAHCHSYTTTFVPLSATAGYIFIYYATAIPF